MRFRSFSAALFLSLSLSLLLSASLFAATSPTRPPNVVIFLADDAGWGD